MLRKIVIVLLVLAAGLGAALYFAAVPDISAAELDQRYGTPPSQFLTLPSGTRVHYRDRPGPAGAPIIVLVHGSNASLLTWEPWAKRLAGRLRVVSVDLPGHGLTGATVEDDYSIAGMAGFLAAFTHALGLTQPFMLAGNSMGGQVALRFALAHPDLVSKLVLVDSGGAVAPGVDGPVPLAFRIARTPVLKEFVRFVTPRSLFESGLRSAFYDQSLVTPAMIDQYWELNRRTGTRATTASRFGLPFDGEPAKHLGDLKMPVLILWGREDRLIPVHSAEVFKAALPQAQLIIYEDCGHVPMEEQADQSAADLLAFTGSGRS
ncbi:MAG: alpha/beta fold hydrolase [Beijerinckiaceae bacterium]